MRDVCEKHYKLSIKHESNSSIVPRLEKKESGDVETGRGSKNESRAEASDE